MMMSVQMRRGSVPQLQSSFVAGKPLAVTPARSGRLVSQRFSGTPQAIFGNKQKQPSLTKSKYDKDEYNPPGPTSAFTRRREVVAGRAAMSGFISALIGEWLTGKGALGQLQLETRLPPQVIDIATLSLVAFNFLTALSPGSDTFSDKNQADVKKRKSGAVQKPSKINPISNPKDTLGISSTFGFTKKNELFVGRVAMLGFASELIGEKLTGGKGPLGQLGFSVAPAAQGYEIVALAIWVGFFLVAAVGYGRYGEQEGGDDVY